MAPDLIVAVDDPRSSDVRALIERHLEFAHEVTPPGHVRAAPVDDLAEPTVTAFSVRRSGTLVGVGALKELDRSHAEIKSMHTSQEARGQGVGRALLDHLISVARDRRYQRVSLETGTGDAFAPARALYRRAGFAPCEPFGEHVASPHSVCFTLALRANPDGDG